MKVYEAEPQDCRRPPMPVLEHATGWCRWCGEPILRRDGTTNWRARWHPGCADLWLLATNSAAQRRVILQRGERTCRTCGVECRGRTAWEADHIDPLWSAPRPMRLADRPAWFGPENLQMLCGDCHRDKCRREASVRALWWRWMHETIGEPA